MPRTSIRRRGLSLIEVIVSIPLVGVALVAALNTVGASKTSQFKNTEMREAHLLAQQLMGEILLQDYADPDLGFTSFAIESGEGNTGNRSLFDDVDDYDLWQASPPQQRDGTVMSHLPDWKRTVTVNWLNTSDLTLSVTTTEIKHIRVKVKRQGRLLCTLDAYKTSGLPPLQACCFGDGTCHDLREQACTNAGGTPKGTDTACTTTTCPTGPTVLFVVNDDASLTPGELARQTLIESWGFRIRLIASSAWQSDFDAAVEESDVAFVSAMVASGELGTKLTSAPIGVVNACTVLIDDFGFASGVLFWVYLNTGDVVNNTHDITDSFPLAPLTLATSSQWFSMVQTGMATGATTLLTIDNSRDSLFAFDTGAALVGGTPAPGRRVQLPWGHPDIDFAAFTEDTKTILRKSLEWGASADVGSVVCGDGTCDASETCSCPVDCPSLPPSETNCADGYDDECDGWIDCDDPDCAADPACQTPQCGNGTCNLGEDCTSCPTDCQGRSTGKPASQYCCGNGSFEPAEGDGTICDGNY